MHPVILGIGLSTQLVVQVSGQIPNFNLEKACKVLSEKTDQGYHDCLNDEKSARQQLATIWSSYSSSIRAQCTRDTVTLGMNSALDLLTCLQMKDDAGSHSKRAAGTKPPN
ncbi:hypothetical protein [Bradyrhizobium sp. S69]|jgi:hypothetical protein|uniref:hypothetical protein n=1 Tax=Bradyrhizobium sp. S69 TaxID=1641856 RepID=UPI00131D42CB|nr:hypothetical protein [Bradyrhizobium sp. S69]